MPDLRLNTSLNGWKLRYEKADDETGWFYFDSPEKSVQLPIVSKTEYTTAGGNTRRSVVWHKYEYTFEMQSTRQVYDQLFEIQKNTWIFGDALVLNYTGMYSELDNRLVLMEISEFSLTLWHEDSEKSLGRFKIYFTEIDERKPELNQMGVF
jgi:hypothetical protein